MYTAYADYAAAVVLPVLCRVQGRKSSIIRELSGVTVSTRQIYSYLRALEAAGKVRRNARGKLWWAV